jgi:hypothetical protein
MNDTVMQVTPIDDCERQRMWGVGIDQVSKTSRVTCESPIQSPD